MNSLAGPPTAVQQVGLTNAPGPVVGTGQLAVCNDPNTPPVANAGPDQTVNDTDGQPGESVTLDGSGTTDVDAGNILTYQWFDLTTDSTLGPASTSPILNVTLAPGPHNIQLSVTDDSGDSATSFGSDDVVVTVNAPVIPAANAGRDQTVSDSDGLPGEIVTLDGSGSSDPDGTIVSYEWFRVIDAETSVPLGTGQTLNVTLPDGVNDVRLSVTDDAGNISSDAVVITVVGATRPIANAGPDRNIPDSDGLPGESVTLDGSASTDPDDTIVLYEWFRTVDVETTELLGTGRTLTVRLPDGTNDITLVVTDKPATPSADDVALITVAARAGGRPCCRRSRA